MSERIRESLSAMLDGEANELEFERVLSRIEQDRDLRDVWTRYHAARDATASHELAYKDLDISVQVRAALADKGQKSVGVTPGDTLRQRFLRPLTSFAVAASVAATVVIGGQQLAQIGGNGAVGQQRAQAASVSPVGMYNSLGATPVRASYGTQSTPVLRPATRTAYQELARQRMKRYMQLHAEQAALNTPQGLMAFSRVSDIRQ